MLRGCQIVAELDLERSVVDHAALLELRASLQYGVDTCGAMKVHHSLPLFFRYSLWQFSTMNFALNS